MKRSVFKIGVKAAWAIVHPTAFVVLMAFVLLCATSGHMAALEALASATALAAMFGFHCSIVVLSRVFARSPAAILRSLSAWNSSDRLSARVALLKHPS